ncbi:MAG: ATP-binding protein, partial [Spirochaetota bacterium]
AGVIGGSMIDFKEIGNYAAELAVRQIVEPSSRSTDISMENYRTVFDSNALRKWGIKENRLPALSTVIHKTPSFLEHYAVQIAAASVFFCIQTIIIILLCYSRKRKLQAEKEFAKSLSLMKAQFENSPDIIFRITRDYTIISANRGVPGIAERDEIIGKTLPNLLPCEQREVSKAHCDQCFTEKKVVEFDNCSFRGTYSHVRLVPVPLTDGIESIFVNVTDTTEKMKAEEREKIMKEQINQADRMISLGLLVSGVAHEINNPAQYILSNLQFLMDSWRSVLPILDEYYREQGDFLVCGLPFSSERNAVESRFVKILSGAGRISLIVDELKSFARKDNGLDRELCDINTIVALSADLLKGMINGTTDYFTVRHGKNIPRINVNSRKIQQVIVNLLINALQSLPSKAAAVDISTAATPDGFVAVSIIDQGKGLSEDELKNISIPFYTTKRNQGGTGLGLFVSKNIIQSYGGNIDFISETGKGTQATVRIPIPFKESGRNTL